MLGFAHFELLTALILNQDLKKHLMQSYVLRLYNLTTEGPQHHSQLLESALADLVPKRTNPFELGLGLIL